MAGIVPCLKDASGRYLLHFFPDVCLLTDINTAEIAVFKLGTKSVQMICNFLDFIGDVDAGSNRATE